MPNCAKMVYMNLDFVEKLREDFPQLNFAESDDFRWSKQENTIFFETESSNFHLLILHELAHALLGHEDFLLDIELLKMESEAWELVRNTLAPQYGFCFDSNFSESKLDTYRDWLHKRSLCPNCKINGFQQKDLAYKCPACGTIWQNNDSRFKNLRRTKK